MSFEKEYPSFKKFGKTHREVWRGERLISEPMWSQSVIEDCCIDKQRVKKIIDKLKYLIGGTSTTEVVNVRILKKELGLE